MAIANDIITRALQRLGIVALGDEPTHEEAEYCLAELNEMLHAWSIDGIDLAHLDLALTDAVDVPDDHLDTVRLSLAERVAGTFGAQVAQGDAMRAELGRRALIAYHFTLADLTSDHSLARRNLASEE